MSFELCQLLMNIRWRPSLYLGNPSLKALDHFTTGYSFKEHEIHGAPYASILDIRGFQRYVEGILGIDETTKSVFTIIIENTKDDEAAFYRFFELLDGFCEQNDIPKLSPTPYVNPHLG